LHEIDFGDNHVIKIETIYGSIYYCRTQVKDFTREVTISNNNSINTDMASL